MNEKQQGLILFSDCQEVKSNEEWIEWNRSIHPDKINGVALVIHGLNLRPDKMETIISLLTHSRIDVLNLSLRGHGENYAKKPNTHGHKARMETFKTISYGHWIKETHLAYDLAEKRSREKQVPLFLIGFSLGGLMGATLFSSYRDVYFNRMVLLAPALNIYKIYYLAKLLSPFPKLVIPSFLMKSYCSNRGTPIAGYTALFEAIKQFNNHLTQKLNVPTLIFIDKKDEMVSYRGLERIIKNKGLYQWKLYPIKKNTTIAPKKTHHLIIDGSAIGIDAWNEMRRPIIHHLLV